MYTLPVGICILVLIIILVVYWIVYLRRISRRQESPQTDWSKQTEEIKEVTEKVQTLIAEIIDTQVTEKHWVTHYGATNIHPRYLMIWICVQSDDERNRLKSDKALKTRLRQALIDANYPQEGRDEVGIDFESQETVDRESGGSWRDHWT